MFTEKIFIAAVFSRLLMIIYHLFSDFEQAIAWFCYFGVAFLFFSILLSPLPLIFYYLAKLFAFHDLF